ncbi:MAG: hypothetical protein ACKVZJ_09570 [Phycisphaerales bacterium]
MRHVRVLACALSAAFMAVCAAGCSGEQAEAMRARLDAAVLTAETAQREAEAQRDAALAQRDAALAAGDTKTADVATKTADVATKAVDEAIDFRKLMETARKELASAINPDGSFNAGGAALAASKWLPPPWNILVPGLGLAVIAGVGEIRTRRAVKAAASIVNAQSAASLRDPTFRVALANNAEVMHRELTPTAVKIVRDNAF